LQVASLGATAVMALACAVIAAQFAGAQSKFLRNTVALARLGYAVPGAAIAMALLWPIAALDHGLANVLSAITGQNVGLLLMGSMAVLVYAYALRFFAVAHGSVAQGAARVSQSSFDAALSLGASRKQALLRVLWPALRPSVAAGFMLAWIDCLKELPATLMLRPFNFDTLPVLAYQWVADERAAQAALPSLLLVIVGLAPVWWLRRKTA
jgi:iron(III) transport system permease protein